MADGIVRIVINAVDKYTGVLTGLNQGLELAGKAFKAISFSADVASKAISASLDLAGKGGAYQEIRDQLDNVARSFGVSADRVVADIDRITLNMTKLPDAAKLAGRGIAIGLNEDQLEKFFTFIKRRTELTGEDFKGLSETVFTALASGRGKSVFASFGIAMKAGESMDDLIKKLEVATGAYGKTSFNTADNLLALATQQDNFTTKIGQAINAAPAFQKILTSITEAAVEFVQSFDPTKLSVFFDFLVTSVEKVARYLGDSFLGVFDYFGSLLVGGAYDFSSFAKSIIGTAAELGKSVVKSWNSVVDAILAFNIGNFVGNGITAVSTAVLQLGVWVAEIGRVIQEIIVVAVKGWEEIFGLLRETAANSPKIFQSLGISEQEIGEVEQNLYRFRLGIEKDFATPVVETFENIGGKILEFNDDFNDSVRKAAKFDPSAFDTLADGANAAIDKIDATILEKGLEKSSEKIKTIAADVAKFSVSNADVATAAVDKLGKSIKNVGKIDSIAGLSPDTQKLIDDLARIEGTIARVQRGGANYKFEVERLEAQAEEIRKRLQIKLSIVDDLKTKDFLTQIKEYLAAVNWPAELQSLGEFLLSFILLKARGERLPLAITTSTG